MSPESRAGSPDVDIRTDVYSLGILLYELIAGVRPRTGADPQAAPRERPSTRLGHLDPASTSRAAECRGLAASDLVGRLRGDLDWIVMTAIAAEPERRYAAVADLAADLARHLADEPVAARPPTPSYRLRKLVRRHRAVAFAAVLVAAALLLGIVATSVAAARARRAEAEAVAQVERADREAAAATEVVELLVDLFEDSDPDRARGRPVTALELVEHGLGRIERDLEPRPVLRGRMMRTIGEVYAQLGLEEGATDLLRRALVVVRDAGGDDEGERAAILRQLARLHSRRQSHGPAAGDRDAEATRSTAGSRFDSTPRASAAGAGDGSS